MSDERPSVQISIFPVQINMPDISAIDYPVLTNRLLIELMAEMLNPSYDKGFSHKAKLYRNLFVRLQDKAIQEYGEAKEALIEFNSKPLRWRPWASFTNHIENCINAVARMFRLFDRIKSESLSPSFPRELSRYLEKQRDYFIKVRGAVEHIDKEIAQDKLNPGKPIALVVNTNGDGVVISKYALPFQELANVLVKFNQIAFYLLRMKNV